MDHFHEEIITNRRAALRSALYWVLTVLMVITGIAAATLLSSLMSLQVFSWALVGAFIVLAGMTVLILLTKGRLRVEYEYCFTNGELDVDKVMNNSQRKRLLTMNIKKIDAMGPVNSPLYDRYAGNPGAAMVKAFLNPEKPLYFIYCAQDAERRLLIIEPSEALLTLLWQYAPRTASLAKPGD